ncbi:hypothetical protein [Sphingomonas gilva]|nr:hypothetical protein [Sphingomonas gilva]
MGEPKPMASLSSSLLARKGHAKPAMRPQGFGGFGMMTNGVDDLGWNDMGHDAQPFEPVAVEAAPELPAQPLPPVLRQREKLVEELVDPVAGQTERRSPRRVADATLAKVSRDVGAKKGKAAFTLRLDGERHLRLRLACAVRHCSAQMLVTEAVDRLLDSLPEVEALAARLPAAVKR